MGFRPLMILRRLLVLRRIQVSIRVRKGIRMILRNIWSSMAVRRAQKAIRAIYAFSLAYCVLAGCPAMLGGSPDSAGCSLADVHIGQDHGRILSVGIAPSDFTIEDSRVWGDH